MLLRASSDLDDDLAVRVSDVLRRGLYDVVPDDHAIQAMIEKRDREERGHDDGSPIMPIDFRQAACRLRCDRTVKGAQGPLPDVVIGWGSMQWLHYDGIAEGESDQDRIDAIGREHAQIAAGALEARCATEEETNHVKDVEAAIATSSLALNPDEMFVLHSANAWEDLAIHHYAAGGLETKRVAVDEHLARAAPRLVTASMTPITGERPTILIDRHVSYLMHAGLPDAVAVMRTLLTLKAGS